MKKKDIPPHVREARGVLSEAECAAVIHAASSCLRPCAPIVAPTTPLEGVGVASVGVACFPRDVESPAAFAEISRYLRELISELSHLPEENQEPFQVVHYAQSASPTPGYGAGFPGWEYLKWESDQGGERRFSFILYLNDVEAGGENDCPELGIRIEPEAGKAAFWHNPVAATGYGRRQHASRPVARGGKWALACWVRESAVPDPTPQEIEALARDGGWNLDGCARDGSPTTPPGWIVEQARRQQERIPYLGAGGPTCRGFEKRTLDPAVFADIRSAYESVLHRAAPEGGPATGTHLDTTSREAPPSLFCEDRAFNRSLLERLRPLHEAWCGFELAPATCYGFRIYLPGAHLHDHVDTSATHVVSSTLCVDRDVRSPWPLHVVDIDGRELGVDLEPGEIALYESARVLHGRPVPLDGRFHVGMFIHYKPANDPEGWAASPKDWWRSRQRARAGSSPAIPASRPG